MITTTYGYKKPVANDKGPTIFPAMEFNIDRLDQHDHDGVNSKPLSASAIAVTTQNILAAGWVLVANGIYKQTVTLAGALLYNNVITQFRKTNGDIIMLTQKKISATTYDVYINDNSIDIVAVYR